MQNALAQQATRGEEISGPSSSRMNAKDQLAHEQTRLEDRLVQVKRGQEILAKNPELLELLEILANRSF